MNNDLPRNPDSERCLLSGIIFNDDAAYDAIRILGDAGAECFTEMAYRTIYETIAKLIDEGEPVTLGTITSRVGIEYRADVLNLSDIAHAVPDPVPYADIVYDYWQRREFVTLCKQLAAQAQGNQAHTVIGMMEEGIAGLGQRAKSEEPATMRDIVPKVIAEYERLADPTTPNVNGIMTGIPILDRKLCGLRPGLIVIAAQPKVGKTTLAVNIPCHASRVNIPSLIFSLEMSKEELVQRVFAIEAAVDVHAMRSGFIAKHELSKAVQHRARIEQFNIHINDTAALTISDIRATARRHVAKYGQSLILIDYMQLIRSNSRYDQRHVELADTANGLKNLSKELNCPVVVLAQLSPEADSCEDGYEMIKKLAGAKAILAALDVGIVLHVPKGTVEGEGTKPIVVTVAASRSTPTGHEQMIFDKKRQRFLTIGHQEEPAQQRSHYDTGDDFDEFGRMDGDE